MLVFTMLEHIRSASDHIVTYYIATRDHIDLLCLHLTDCIVIEIRNSAFGYEMYVYRHISIY